MLGVLAGVLLPVPLVLVVLVAWRESWQVRTPARMSPVLTREERLQRVTYQRRCQKSAECEPPLGCLKNPQLTEFFCTDSQCVTDAQCAEGKSCQVFLTEGDGPRIRACVTQGVRREGEECWELPAGREQACEPGLRCIEGWCGRPCRTDTPESCPEGFFCADDAAGPVCLPTCEGRSCPEGQQCVSFPTRAVSQPVTACKRVYGTDCLRSPCAEGQRCIVNHVPNRPDEVWMACMQRCGQDDAPACPNGLVCVRPYCRQPCDPRVPGACGEAMKCEQLQSRVDEPWVCRPEL